MIAYHESVPPDDPIDLLLTLQAKIRELRAALELLGASPEEQQAAIDKIAQQMVPILLE